jgi:hypothetical protein
VSDQFYFWRTEFFSTIAVPLVVAATRVRSPERVEGELHLIFHRPSRYAGRKEIAINSAPQALNGLALAESDILTELRQQVEWIVQNAVSGEELSEFRRTGRPLRIEEPANSLVVAQTISENPREIEWIAATTQWPSLRDDLRRRLAALAKLPPSMSPLQ